MSGQLPSLNFERSDLLRPILDNLEANDRYLFDSIKSTILTKLTSQGLGHSTPAVSLVYQGLRDALTGRGNEILSEMRRVLEGVYVDDCDDLAENLKAELTARLDSTARLASSSFQELSRPIRASLPPFGMPSETAILDHVETLKSRLFAEIGLFCAKLHDSQAPRLFLKVGEVFAGNRAGRAIFAAATQSLDIIDTYFGPQVLDMLEVSRPSVKIRLISDKISNVTKNAYDLFKQQYGRIEFRICDPKDIHDRFVIIDGKKALHLGHSIKDLGKSDTLIDATALDPHKKRFEELWLKGNPVT